MSLYFIYILPGGVLRKINATNILSRTVLSQLLPSLARSAGVIDVLISPSSPMHGLVKRVTLATDKTCGSGQSF